jgi:hypothetical protein
MQHVFLQSTKSKKKEEENSIRKEPHLKTHL